MVDRPGHSCRSNTVRSASRRAVAVTIRRVYRTSHPLSRKCVRTSPVVGTGSVTNPIRWALGRSSELPVLGSL